MRKLSMFSVTAAATALLVAPGWSVQSQTPIREKPLQVSIVQLISNPADFEGRLVSFHGFVNLQFEDEAVYLHREDYEHRSRENGFWLDAGPCTHPDGTKFNQGYALVVGRFTSTQHGHLGAWPGQITEATCVGEPSYE